MARVLVVVSSIQLGRGFTARTDITVSLIACGRSLATYTPAGRAPTTIDPPCTLGGPIELPDGGELALKIVVHDGAGADHPVEWAPPIPDITSDERHAFGHVTATVMLVRLDGPPINQADVVRASASEARSTICVVVSDEETHIARVWGFPPSHIFTPRTRREVLRIVASTGLTDVVFFLNDEPNANVDRTFELLPAQRAPQVRRVSRTLMERSLVELAQALRDIQVDVHLMVWPKPVRSFMEGLINTSIAMCRAVRPRSLSFDAERPWRTAGGAARDVTGALSLISGRLIPALRDINCQIGTSDFFFHRTGTHTHPIHDDVWRLAEICDFVLPQAYSTTTPPRSAREPGAMQRDAHAAYGAVGKPVVMLLAAWDLLTPASMPSATEYETMAFTVDEVEMLTNPAANEIGYWWRQGERPDAGDFTGSGHWCFIREIAYRARRRFPFTAWRAVR